MLVIEPTPGDKAAWYSPQWDVILMRPGLLQVERRCALAHELAHRALEHSGQCRYPDAERQDRRQERDADEWAARRLITVEQLADALVWSDDPAEVADCLWVTPHLLTVRLDTIYLAERLRVGERLRAAGIDRTLAR